MSLRPRRTLLAGIVVAVIVIAAIGAGLYFSGKPVVLPTTGTATTEIPTGTATTEIPEPLVIDEFNYPIHLNQLWGIQSLAYPDWPEFVVYQTLVVTHPTSEHPLGELNEKGELEFLPALATDWTISPDSRIYTYNLKQGVKFSSGNPFNSYQVWTQMYTWYYLNANGTNFLGGLVLFDMSNVNFGPASYDLLRSSGLASPTGRALEMMQDTSWPIYTKGPYQIVFHTKAPFLYLNGLLVGFQGLLFDCQWALENGGFGTPAEFNPYFEGHPMPGTGPYMFAEIVPNDHVKFVKNPNYWGANLSSEQIDANPFLSPGQAKTVIIYYKTDDIARLTDLSTGAAHIVVIKGKNWPLVSSDPQYDYVRTGTGGARVCGLAFNTVTPPMDNVNLRRAIVHAIDYSNIWAKAFAGQAGYIVGPESPNYGIYYNPGNLPPYEYDLSKARDYMMKSGYKEGPLTLTLRYMSGSSQLTAMAEVIQSDLAKIGITLVLTELPPEVYYVPYGSYATSLKNAKDLGDMSFLGGGGCYAPDYLAPPNFWVNFVTTSSLWGNTAVYSNPVVEESVSLMLKSSDTEEILAHLKVAQQQIYDDAPYAWLGSPGLLFEDGSVVWNRNVIKQVFVEPAAGGMNTAPIFNTVVFASTVGSTQASPPSFESTQELAAFIVTSARRAWSAETLRLAESCS